MEPEKKRLRGSNYTADEKLLLLNVVKEYQFIIHSKKLDQITMNRKAAAWKRITDKFNAINRSNNINRTEESLRKFYGYARKKIRDDEDENVMENESNFDSKFNMGSALENPFEVDITRLSDESNDLLENISQIHKELDSMNIQPDRKRRRSSNYTLDERMLLLNIMKEFKHIIHNKKTDHATLKIKSEAWTKIVEKFNAISWTNKILRTEESLKKYYENIKKTIQKEEEFGDNNLNVVSVKSGEKSRTESEHFEGVISEESNQSVLEINRIEPDNSYTVNEKILLLNIIKEYQHIIDNKNTDQIVVWTTITDKFNAIYFPTKFVRTTDSLRNLFYENFNNKLQSEEGGNEITQQFEIKEECPIYSEEQPPVECDTVVVEESENGNNMNKKTEEILPECNNKRTTHFCYKSRKITGLKIELYQLKKKSIMLDNEIKQEQLRQERIKTQILEFDLKRASRK